MIKFIVSRNIFFAFIMLLPTLGHAQVIQTNTKNNTVDYKKLAMIDGLVNDYIAKNWLTGAVTIVIKDN